MKLEDFLKQRSNYVERDDLPVASEEEMKAHFAKAAQNKYFKKSPPKISEAAIAPREIPVEAIAPTPEVQPTIPEPLESPSMPTSIVEAEEVIEQAIREPASQAQSPDSNLWYFLPAALGALTGNIGEGAAASSQGIGMARARQEKIDDYNRTLEAKLKAMATQRGEGKLYEIDQDGKPIFATAEQAKGKQAFKAQKLDDLGKDERQRRAQEFTERMKLTDRQENAVKDFIKPNSEFSNHLSNMQLSVSAMRQLNEGGPIAESGLPSLIARGVFKEKGVLTEQDVKRVAGDPSLLAQYNRTLSKALEGKPLTENDRKDVSVLLKVGYNEEIERMNKVSNKFIKTKKATGLDVEEPIKIWLQDSIEPMPGLKGAIAPSRQLKPNTSGKPKRIEQNGVIYILNEKTGQYE
jgi:hypothetical protein